MADQFDVPENILGGINKTTVIAKGGSILDQLVRTYNLQNVSIIPQPKTNYQVPIGTGPDPALYMSTLGTPVMSDITFVGNNYTDDNGNIVAFSDIKLETVLITLDQTKNIVKTPIQGRAGTVKEYIGLGDYIVKIDGLLTSTNGVFPKDQLTELKTMLTAPISIQVTSWYLQLFDIDYIVIEAYSVPQLEGGYSQQPFSINALSDNEVQLIVQ